MGWEGDCPRELVRRGRFEPKTMFSVFFKRSGLVHLSYLENGKTINHELYIEECLKSIVKVLKNEKNITRSVTKIVSAIDKKEWIKTFDKWVERMRLCISSQGYYFEHLLK